MWATSQEMWAISQEEPDILAQTFQKCFYNH